MSKPRIYLILNNIRSAYNVGSIFRTADGAGVTKIYLCGITPTPLDPNSKFPEGVALRPYGAGQIPNSNKIAKTALGAEKTVPWEYHAQTWRLLRKLKSKNEKVKIIALEQTKKSTNLFKYKPPKNKDIALIVGNEVKGLNKKILSYADKIVEIPMYGKKESLNVAVATGIALYQLARNF